MLVQNLGYGYIYLHLLSKHDLHESTDTNRVENLYRLLAIMPPNETTAQKQEEVLEKKESQQIVALKSLVAELEAKIKTVGGKTKKLPPNL